MSDVRYYTSVEYLFQQSRIGKNSSEIKARFLIYSEFTSRKWAKPSTGYTFIQAVNIVHAIRFPRNQTEMHKNDADLRSCIERFFSRQCKDTN